MGLAILKAPDTLVRPLFFFFPSFFPDSGGGCFVSALPPIITRTLHLLDCYQSFLQHQVKKTAQCNLAPLSKKAGAKRC